MAATYNLGPFRLDTATDTLFRGGEPVSLGHRAVALLRVLVEQPGIPVSKDALMEAAWAGLTVEESNLAVQIAALRRVFGEETGGENWIETLPRRGYRFIGPTSMQDKVHRCVAGREFCHGRRFLEPHASGQAIYRHSAVSELQRGP
jgi:DNA-binding winged helix-turn-helix (wHTH) protein